MKILARANKKLRGNGKFYTIPEPTKSWFYVTEYDSNGYPIKAKTIGCSGDMTDSMYYAKSSGGIMAKLQEFEINDGVTNISDYAFQSCSSLTRIIIPDSVTSIGTYAIYGCSNLTNITIPTSVTRIGSYAFRYCSKLEEIIIPSLVTSIEPELLANCKALKSIKFLGDIKSINNWAFEYCSSCLLFDFRNCSQVPTLSGTSVFTSTPSTKKIVVPDALYDSWITATNWSSTSNNIVSSIIKASDYEASL